MEQKFNGVETVTESGLSIIRINAGEGIIGRNRLVQLNEEAEYSHSLTLYNEVVNSLHIFGCIDGRNDLEFAEIVKGLNDQESLYNIIGQYLPGGPGLATAKALVCANASVIKDAKTMGEAYVIAVSLLSGIGIEDGGHPGCGASVNARATVESPLSSEAVITTLGQVIDINGTDRTLLNKISANKKEKAATNFMDNWTPENHIEFLLKHFPRNFAKLATANDETHGHHERSLFIATKGGFKKNAFVRDTGDQTFCFTAELAQYISAKLGITQEEKRTIYLAFLDDLLNVGVKLITPGMPVFTGNNPKLSLAA